MCNDPLLHIFLLVTTLAQLAVPRLVANIINAVTNGVVASSPKRIDWLITNEPQEGEDAAALCQATASAHSVPSAGEPPK